MGIRTLGLPDIAGTGRTLWTTRRLLCGAEMSGGSVVVEVEVLMDVLLMLVLLMDVEVELEVLEVDSEMLLEVELVDTEVELLVLDVEVVVLKNAVAISTQFVEVVQLSGAVSLVVPFRLYSETLTVVLKAIE